MISPTKLAPATAADQTANNPAAAMSKDGFLKLLMGQLQHQDPMDPSKNEDVVGQMAQFSMLEQVGALAKANEALASSLRTGQAVSLIGRNVTYKATDGATATGVVEKVDVDGTKVTLTVAGVPGIDPAAVREVR